MDFLNGKIKTIYYKYLVAAFGSALITSIYSIVDMAMVGQYHGPDGSAALAVVNPVWNIIYSLGLLMGIGGSVLFSATRGKSEGKEDRSNEYFAASVVGAVILAVIVWIVILLFDKQLLTAFGAEESLLPLARDYVRPVKFAVPLFLFNQMLATYLRNDKNPGLATATVLAGGIFNIFGDYFFVFTCDMGAFGAGLATAIGSGITFIVMLSHFFTKKNTLRLVKPEKLFGKLREICVTGFSTFFIDVAMGILTILFNRQIVKYLGTDALAVYGIIVNISSFVQCCAYSVGQAAQPIISTNFGAGNGKRIRETLKYALGTAVFFSIFWTVLSLAAPNLYVRIFMSPTEEILRIAPGGIRCYSISFLLLPLNIFSTYYFQAMLKPKAAFIVSVARGLVVNGIFIYLLPIIAGPDSIWFAMVFTEAVVAVYVVNKMLKYTREMSTKTGVPA